MAMIAPRCATTRNGPMGDSTMVHMSGLLWLGLGGVEGRPEVHEGVRAPRPPPPAQLLGVFSRPAEVGERAADTDVGGKKDVGVAERAHRDVSGRPRPDAWQGQQVGSDLL